MMGLGSVGVVGGERESGWLQGVGVGCETSHSFKMDANKGMAKKVCKA